MLKRNYTLALDYCISEGENYKGLKRCNYPVLKSISLQMNKESAIINFMEWLFKLILKFWKWLFKPEPATGFNCILIEWKQDSPYNIFIEHMFIEKLKETKLWSFSARHFIKKVRFIKNGEKIMIKLRPTQFVDVAFFPVDRFGHPAQIQSGSGSWSVVGTDLDGNPISDLTVEQSSESELRARLKSGNGFGTGILTFQADGDPDSEEVGLLVATASIQILPENAIGGEIKSVGDVGDQTVEQPEPEQVSGNKTGHEDSTDTSHVVEPSVEETGARDDTKNAPDEKPNTVSGNPVTGTENSTDTEASPEPATALPASVDNPPDVSNENLGVPEEQREGGGDVAEHYNREGVGNDPSNDVYKTSEDLQSEPSDEEKVERFTGADKDSEPEEEPFLDTVGVKKNKNKNK